MEKFTSTKLGVQNDLTKSQSLLWTGQEMHPESPMYNMVLVFDFQGEIRIDHFQVAFQEMINGSDAMRTVFNKVEGKPIQKVLPKIVYEMEVLDLSKTQNTKETYKKWESARTKLNFDLTKCLFDSVLIKISESRFFWYFNQHHLTTDAWSTSVIYKRMAELYRLSCQDNLDNAFELPQFQEFIDFEKKAIQENEVVENYWKKKLGIEVHQPKLYNEKIDESTSESTRIHLNLGVERSEKLRQLGLDKAVRSWTPNLTLYNIFLTTLFAYLYRVSGQRKLVVGSPAHNRPTNDFKNTIGIFIEIFPLFAEITEDETFVSLLKKVQLESNGFLKYAQPGASKAELNRNFNVFFNYINASYSDFNGVPMNSEWVHSGHSDPRHHLRLQVHDFDKSGAIQLYFDLNIAALDKAKQKLAPQHFLTLLDAFIVDKEVNLNKVSILTQDEYQKVVVDFNTNNLKASENHNIIELIEIQANKSPEATALVFKELSLTYNQLNERANRLAHYLVSRNIGSGSQVAILLKRSPEYVIGVLAALKTGATFIPIPSNYPEERIKYLLEDCNGSMLISNTEILEPLGSFDTEIIAIDSLDSILENLPSSNLSLGTSKDTTAFLIYTSGSTGKPKGVKITNGALSNYIKWTEDTYINTPSPAIPLFTTVGFDITANSVFLPLICGGSIHVYQETDLAVDLSILDVISDNKVDFIKLTPAHLSFLKGKKYPDSNIDVMVVTGDEFKTELGNHIHEAFNGKLKMYNEYGPAEATIGCIYHKFTPDIESSSVPIGKPIHNMQVYILDENRNAVPQGVVGEIYLAGTGLADGYWERPDLTSEKFLPNPFSPGTKMYRTQDLARLNNGGIIEFLGRTDFQVKINGHRIELGEIESQLTDFDSIDGSVVLLDDKNGLKSLTAYFTANEPVSLSGLQSYLIQKLPRYMVPSHFKQLDEFPLSSNGKIDRKVLKTLNATAVKSKSEFVPPQTEIEEIIAEIWQEVLDVPKIGVHDNFLDLGGESLMALRATSRMNEALELNISLDRIFKLPTVAKISEYVEETIIELLKAETTV